MIKWEDFVTKVGETKAQDFFEEYKKNIDVYHDDEDEKIKSEIARGMGIFNIKLNHDLNYLENPFAKQMLFDYCRFVRNNAGELFFKDDFYGKEFNHLNLLTAVKDMEESE